MNEDRVVLDHIRELRSLYPNIHTFYETLDEQLTSVSVSAQNNGWMMYINFLNTGSRLLSTRSFKKLNIIELFVRMRNVIKGGHKVNELMMSFIEEKIKSVGVEAFLDPPVVKQYKPSTLHNMTLTNECLERSHLEFMKSVEGQLRCKENRTNQYLIVVELLYAFRLNKAVGISTTYLKRENRYYIKPVFMTKEDGTEGTEAVADSHPCIKVQDVKAWFCFKKDKGGRTKIGLDKLKLNNSTSIKRVLSMIKMSTCK